MNISSLYWDLMLGVCVYEICSHLIQLNYIYLHCDKNLFNNSLVLTYFMKLDMKVRQNYILWLDREHSLDSIHKN